jgi:hypothetical protein
MADHSEHIARIEDQIQVMELELERSGLPDDVLSSGLVSGLLDAYCEVNELYKE